MSDSTDQESDRTTDGDAGAREVTAWRSVPAAPGETVPVRWTDLRAMRRRIDALEREVAELEGELTRSHARRRRVVERYEALLDRRDAWGETVPRSGGTAPEKPNPEPEPAMATDGGDPAAVTGRAGRDDAAGADGAAEQTSGRGTLGGLLAAVAAVFSRG